MRHRTKRLRWPVLAAAGLLVAGSGAAYAITDDGSAGSYRTATATRGDVEQLLTTSGTVDAARRSDLEFAASGTVASVRVALGETVKAGQVVATLETGELEAAVTRARASLARAIAQLESDQDAQDQTVADAVPAQTGTKPKSGGSPSGSPSAAALATLHAQQADVVAAQSAATAALTAAKEALAAQTEACKDAYQDEPSAPASHDAAAAASESAASAATSDDDACSAALAEVQARQQDVDTAQDALAAALSTLAKTLSDALATLASQGGGTGTPSTSARTSADSPASEGSETPATGDAGTATSSAARLAADQADIEQARADLVDARQQLRQAVVRSTRAGKVRSLGVAAGDEVSAGDVAAVVVGGRAVTLEASVPESKIGQVKVGQRVAVSTPGETGTADGTVTAIGLVADTSSGTASYPVTVTVEDPALALPTGSEAMLAIVVATATDVVTVPTSAVTRRGDGAVVQVWDGAKISRESVTVGTVGARSVEVTDGLEVGDQVVLADLDQAITGASDTLNDRGGPGGGPVFRVGGPGGAKGPGGGPVRFQSGG